MTCFFSFLDLLFRFSLLCSSASLSGISHGVVIDITVTRTDKLVDVDEWRDDWASGNPRGSVYFDDDLLFKGSIHGVHSEERGLYQFRNGIPLTTAAADNFTHSELATALRKIGFLYLSYVGDPKTLWKWFEPYVKDDEWFLSAIPVNSWNIALSASSNLFLGMASLELLEYFVTCGLFQIEFFLVHVILCL
ncbi:hypothetical protein K1719_027407 [Acacia pycnantha]|nr:hypothetical protein K1719_027407 [Acacia pycnantha]